MQQGNPPSFTPPLHVMQCRALNTTKFQGSSTLPNAVCQDMKYSDDKTIDKSVSVFETFQQMDNRNKAKYIFNAGARGEERWATGSGRFIPWKWSPQDKAAFQSWAGWNTEASHLLPEI